MKQIGKAIGCIFPKVQTVSQTFTQGNKYLMGNKIREDPLNYTGKVIPGSIRTVLNAI